MQVGEWRQDRTGLVKTLAALANTRGGAETESSYSPATAHRTLPCVLLPSSYTFTTSHQFFCEFPVFALLPDLPFSILRSHCPFSRPTG